MTGHFYMISNKDNTLWLPHVGRGATFAEPTDMAPPRLFRQAYMANSALTWWLKGAVTQVYIEGDYRSMLEPSHLRTVPRPERADLGMHVQLVTLLV